MLGWQSPPGAQVVGGGEADHLVAARPPVTDRPARPWWVMMAIEVSHCGAGCVLGDVISEFAVFWLSLAIAGLVLGAEYAGDYLLASLSASSFSISRLRRCAASG